MKYCFFLIFIDVGDYEIDDDNDGNNNDGDGDDKYDENDDDDDDDDGEADDDNHDDGDDKDNENDDDDDENSAGCGDILQPPNRKPQVRVPQPTLETDHINATNPKCKAGKYFKFGIRAKIWPPKLTIFDTLG